MIKVSYNKISPCPYSLRQVSKAFEILSKNIKINGELELNVIDDKEMKKINKQYRGKNNTTDVLSFAWMEEKTIQSSFLGQMYISFEQIKRQSAELGVPVKEEFFRMLAHGLLHLVGYDHKLEKEARVMFDLQDQILAKVLREI